MSEYFEITESPYLDNSHWAGGFAKSAEIELAENQTLEKLHMISARLLKNNFFASTLVRSYQNAILSGKINHKILYPNKGTQEYLNQYLAESLCFVDINEEYNLEQFLESVIYHSFEKGDVLINMVYDESKLSDNKVSLELIDASRVKTPLDKENDRAIKNGVQYVKGKVSGYWVQQEMDNLYDLDKFDKYNLFPKYINNKQVSMLFRSPYDVKVGVSRKIPVCTPIFGLLRYIAQLYEAVLISARVGACFVGIMNSDNPANTMKNLNKNGANDPDSGFDYVRLKPATLMVGKNGKASVDFASPNRPSDNMDDFFRRLCIFVSAELRMSYSQLFLDLSDINFSSYRSGSIEAERTVEMWHSRLNTLCNWYIYNILLEKKFNSKSFKLSDCRIINTFPKFRSLDDEKIARARKIALQNNTDSVQNICAEEGSDYDRIQQEIAEHEIRQVERQAEMLKLQKSFEQQYGILFNTKENNQSVKEYAQDETVYPEERNTKRKEDGNY